MNTLKCSIGECPSVFQTEEPIHPNARYVCRLHNKTEQKVFFQKNQFDKGLKQGRAPIGTAHIGHSDSSNQPVVMPDTDD